MPLTTANQNAANARRNIPVNLVYLDVAGDPVWAWSGRGDLPITSAGDPLLASGRTFLGVGDVGSVGTITHAADGSIQSMLLGLSYTDMVSPEATAFVNDIGSWSQRQAVVWRAFARTDGAGGFLFDVPFRILTGRMQHVANSNGSAASLTVRIVSRSGTDGQRASAWRLADAHQRAFYPSDGALSYIPLLMQRELRFGVPNDPVVQGGGGGRSNPLEQIIDVMQR